ASASGLVLGSTSAKKKDKIIAALDKLNAGGSTAGGEGLRLAYKVAEENFIKNGNNRVILATDGDFNVGERSDEAMVKLIEEKRESGIFISVLGFGRGNLKDSKMEKIADKGNGNYAYIDNLLEAKKVLVKEMGGTLFTIAKDVKLQVEFNPSYVQSYRLIGYENRLLNNEDFNDDTKDAGEIGAGHTVTAFYEFIPTGAHTDAVASVDPLKYQQISKTTAADSYELMNVKFRYKEPDGEESKLIVKPVLNGHENWQGVSTDFRFAASVAHFGLLLRDSKFLKAGDYESIRKEAKAAKGEDSEGYRAEFIQLVEKADLLSDKYAKRE
ncbi:MAG: YfbK domain-containing protein, partial [Bacteroidota bacterium]